MFHTLVVVILIVGFLIGVGVYLIAHKKHIGVLTEMRAILSRIEANGKPKP